MTSAISAMDWPVFEDYEVRRLRDGKAYVRPCDGASICSRINLMNPATRHAALEAAIRIVRWDPDNERMAQYFGVGDLDESELLRYVRKYGLLGLGPSYIIHAVQILDDGKAKSRVTYRVAGELRMTPDGSVLGAPSLTLFRPFALRLESWRFIAIEGRRTEDIFRLPIGSDGWWETYAEPLDDITKAVGSLRAAPVTIEPLLSDTFTRLPGTQGAAPFIDPSAVIVRSVSAIGALALDVADGGLTDVRVCEYELCRKRFIPSRADKKFCTISCRTSKHDRDKRLARKAERGGGQ